VNDGGWAGAIGCVGGDDFSGVGDTGWPCWAGAGRAAGLLGAAGAGAPSCAAFLVGIVADGKEVGAKRAVDDVGED
jgi:hypothetical protein